MLEGRVITGSTMQKRFDASLVIMIIIIDRVVTQIWEELTNQLKEDHTVFKAVDRAQMLDDAFSLCRAGEFLMVTHTKKNHQFYFI